MFVGGYQGEHGQEEAAAAAATIKAQPPLLSLQVQGDQLNMAVFFLYLVKSTCPVYTCTVANIGQVTFYEIPDKQVRV